MRNLLEQTISVLSGYNKTSKDVEWIGISNSQQNNFNAYDLDNETFGYMLWQDFQKIANIKYDNGFGGQEINSNLLVVGKDFWLERHEYDGSQWWQYKTMPSKPIEYNPNINIHNKY